MAKKPVKKETKVDCVECTLAINCHIGGKLFKAGSKISLSESTAKIWKKKNKIK